MAREFGTMDIKTIVDGLAVSPQITVQDIPAIVAAGYRSLICHRPDGEAPDQPVYKEIEAAAHAAGLTTYFQPIVPGQLSNADADTFAAVFKAMPQPTLAYCRTGTRSASLWSLAQAKVQPLPEVTTCPR
jgi:sulfide:quinone oxidoreductase